MWATASWRGSYVRTHGLLPSNAPTSAIWKSLPDGVLADLAVIDASFIGLELVLPPTLRLLTPTGQIVALVKPQFQAGPDDVGKGGVVRDAQVHRRVLDEIAALARTLFLSVAGLTVSPVPGPAGTSNSSSGWTNNTACPGSGASGGECFGDGGYSSQEESEQ